MEKRFQQLKSYDCLFGFLYCFYNYTNANNFDKSFTVNGSSDIDGFMLAEEMHARTKYYSKGDRLPTPMER